MPTLTERFEDFERVHLASLWSMREFSQQLEVRFGPEEGLEYCMWEVDRARQGRMEARTPPMSRNELVHFLDTMDYNDRSSRAKLVTAMYREITPWIPIGRDENGDFYRIVLNPDALLPDQRCPPESHGLVWSNVLGVNTNVQPHIPTHNRANDRPEKSRRINVSDDSDDSGFIFHQIGNVEIWCDEQGNLQTLKDAGEGPWFTDSYAAVMRINKSGASNGVYVMFDFYEPDDVNGNRFPKRNDPSWGHLGDGTTQFSCARIADKISDLDLFRPFHLTEIITHPVEIVRVINSAQGSMIRATIAE